MSINCSLVRGLVPEYAAGALDGRDRAAVEAHLQGCAECRSAADDYVEVADVVLALAPSAEPPVAFEAAVMNRIAATTRRTTTRRTAARWLAAAAAVLTLGLGLGRLSSAAPQLETAALQAHGHTVGTAWVHRGTPGWIYVDMTYREPYPSIRVEVVDAVGTVTPVGALTLHAGHGTLGTRSPVPVASVRTIRMIEPDGSVLCEGQLPA